MTTQRRKRSRAGTTEMEDGQLLEVAELGPPPRATVAIHDGTAEDVAKAKATVESLGHTLLGVGSGPSGVARIVKLIREDKPPHVVVVGLPGGDAIVDAALAMAPHRPVLIAAVGGPASTAPYRAHAAGADLVTARPHDLEHLGPTLMAAAALSIERARVLHLQATESMLRARVDQETDAATGFHTVERFKKVLELELKRARRFSYALSVCNLAMVPRSPPPPPAVVQEMRVRTTAAIREAIRDIDFPVEIADDRFLVLLPYTDSEGAAAVAKRILAGVAEVRVRANGRQFMPMIAAGVAGIAPGGPVSMAALMRDAGEALKDALRRSVALVIAP